MEHELPEEGCPPVTLGSSNGRSCSDRSRSAAMSSCARTAAPCTTSGIPTRRCWPSLTISRCRLRGRHCNTLRMVGPRRRSAPSRDLQPRRLRRRPAHRTRAERFAYPLPVATPPGRPGTGACARSSSSRRRPAGPPPPALQQHAICATSPTSQPSNSRTPTGSAVPS